MGIVSRAAVVAPDRERERERGEKEQRKNGEREKNVSAANGPAPENRYGRTDERGMSGGRKEGRQLRWGFSSSRGEAGMPQAPRRPRHLQNPSKIQ